MKLKNSDQHAGHLMELHKKSLGDIGSGEQIDLNRLHLNRGQNG
jgi:hypothetical protein